MNGLNGALTVLAVRTAVADTKQETGNAINLNQRTEENIVMDLDLKVNHVEEPQIVL